MVLEQRAYRIEINDLGPVIVIGDYAPNQGMVAGEISEYRDKVLTLFWGSSQVSEMKGAGTNTLEYLRGIETKFDEVQEKVNDAVKALDELVDDRAKLGIRGNINEGTVSMRAALSEYMMTTIAYVVASGCRAEEIPRQLKMDYARAASSYSEKGKRDQFDMIIRQIAADVDLEGNDLISALHEVYPIQRKQAGGTKTRFSSSRGLKDRLMGVKRVPEEQAAATPATSQEGPPVSEPVPTAPLEEIAGEQPAAEEPIIPPEEIVEEQPLAVVESPEPAEDVAEEEPLPKPPEPEEEPEVEERAGEQPGAEEVYDPDDLVEVDNKGNVFPVEPDDDLVEVDYKGNVLPVEVKEKKKKKKPGRVRKAAKVIALLGIIYGGVHIAYTHFPQTRGILKPAAPIIEKVDGLVQRIIN